jgi:hypothetical protein
VVVPGGVSLLVTLGVLIWVWPESRRVLFAAVLLPGIVLGAVAGWCLTRHWATRRLVS